MVLNLKELFVGGAPILINYAMDLSDFELFGARPFAEPVRVTGRVENRAGVVTLQARAQTTLHTQCDRCLAPIRRPLQADFENVLVTETQGDENDELLVCEDQMLDMDTLARTNLVLALPMKELCRPDCKGLCPRCGKDLNDGPCGCKPEEHTAFSKLRELLD